MNLCNSDHRSQSIYACVHFLRETSPFHWCVESQWHREKGIMSWTVKQACTILTARRDTLHRRLGFCCKQAVCGKCSALHFPGPSPSDRPTCLRLSLASRRLKNSFRTIYTLSCALVKWAIGAGGGGSSQIACANICRWVAIIAHTEL